MEVQPRLRVQATRTFFLTITLMLSPGVWADGAQTPNPLFQQAQDLWQKISASQLSQDQKAEFGKRFGDLAAEQRQLWSEAGSVDQGECTDQCLDSYNAAVGQWQSDLTAFSNDAQAVLEGLTPETGIWQPQGDFHQVNVGCFQVWICVPATAVMHDPAMRIVSEPAEKSVVGVCQATNDSVDNCGSCTATYTPPKEICTWHLEPNR